jgi:hypothetical protein
MNHGKELSNKSRFDMIFNSLLKIDFLGLIQYGENLEKPSNLDEDVDEEDFVNSNFRDLDLKEIEIVKA